MSNSPELIGAPVARLESEIKVTGSAAYTSDRLVDHRAFGVLLKSTVGRGHITSVDVSAAAAMPGFIGAPTPYDHPTVYRARTDRTLGRMYGEGLAPFSKEVFYFGQSVGVLVAETFEQARAAAAKVIIHYENIVAPTVVAAEAEKQSYEPKAVDGLAPHLTPGAGDGKPSVEEAWAANEVKIDATFLTPIIHHQPMEPHATVAVWTGDRLLCYEGCQWMVSARNNLADTFGIPEENVRVFGPYVGGAFGSKGKTWLPKLYTATAAKHFQRPVKLAVSRPKMVNSVGHRPCTSQRVQIGARRDGTLTALRHFSLTHTAMHEEFVEATGHRTSRIMYACPAAEISHRLFRMNTPAPTFMRGPGEAPGMFALESAMDELAVALAMDPIGLRLKNGSENNPDDGLPWSAKRLHECFTLGAEKFGWSRRDPLPGSMRDKDWLVGWGMATAHHTGNRSGSSARVRLLANGDAVVSSATHEIGTGIATVMAQVAAQELSLPIERMTAETGDSDLPFSTFAGSSRSTASVMLAVRVAAAAVLKQIIALAIADPKSPLAKLTPADVIADNGSLVARSDSTRRDRFEDILNRGERAAVSATESAAPAGEDKNFSFASWGAMFTEVRVHELTREVRIARFVAVVNPGRVMNARTARSQISGSVIFGLGMALVEESPLDPTTGRFVNGDFDSYHIPVNGDIPPIEVHFVEEPDLNFNPLGARGIGEIGVTGSVAAVANAVYHATGKRVRELPITLDKLL